MRWPFLRQNAPEPETPKRAPRPAPARNATVPREMYDDLMDKYHALAMAHSAPAAPAAPAYATPPASPLDALGPLTHAALIEMSVGMSSAGKRAMNERTIALSATLTDEQLADRVRKGETVRMINIG